MTGEPIDIDGSEGEGGGQILRTALSLSLVTGRPFRLRNVRAGRKKPGLLRQHLAALRASTAVGDAVVRAPRSARPRSPSRPAPCAAATSSSRSAARAARRSSSRPCSRRCCTPTRPAASCSRAAPTTRGRRPSTSSRRPSSRSSRAWAPASTTALEHRGFFPAGGGRFTATVEPVASWQALSLPARGEIRARRARILLANLPKDIAASEERMLKKLLPAELWSLEHERTADGRGPGNVVLLEVETEHVTEVFSAFGEVGVRADSVAHAAVDEQRAWLAADVPVGPHLADQLLLPLALGAGGSFRTLAPTQHTRTNADVIRRFLPDVTIDVVGEGPATTITVRTESE